MTKLNALQQAKNMFKKYAQKITGRPALQAVAQTKPENTPIDINVLLRNLLDQTPYTQRARQQISEIPINAQYLPNKNYGGLYNGGITINTSNLNPNNTLGILRHEIGHGFDVNAQGYNYTPALSDEDYFRKPGVPNSYGIMRLLQRINPAAASRLEGRLSDWGQFYGTPYSSPKQYSNVGNWRDTETYATMSESPNRIVSPEIRSRFPQYIPMSKNINYSPVYPAPELLTRK